MKRVPKVLLRFQVCTVLLMLGVACVAPAAGDEKAAGRGTDEADAPVKIFLLGGQSNMVGGGQPKNLNAPYDAAPANVKIWNRRKEQWESLSTEVVTKRGRFGPEVSFGHAIAAALPDQQVRLVKYAASGTALYNDWAPGKGPQYAVFMNTARRALANLDEADTRYEIAGMLWLQGESDAHERRGKTYEKNLTAFIAHMREKFRTPQMPFLIARVLSHYGGKTGQAKLVRDAQVKVASETDNVAWFDTDDVPIVDPVKNKGHYNGPGLLEIGKRFAAEYTKMTDADPTSSTAETEEP